MKVAGLLLLLSTAGCGLGDLFGGDRVNPEVPSWYNRPAGVMSVFVHRDLVVPGRGNGEDWERGRPEIDAMHDRVFVGSSDRGLYALRAGEGSTIWRFETLGVVQSEPLYDPEMDYVYFGSNDGALYCVSAASGKLNLSDQPVTVSPRLVTLTPAWNPPCHWLVTV